MGDISQIQVNGTTYNVKDLTATEALGGKVSKSGDTMSGDLYIHKGKSVIALEDSDWPSDGSNPTSNRFVGVRANNKNSVTVGFISFDVYTTGQSRVRNQIKNQSGATAYIETRILPDGSNYSYLSSTPDYNDNSTKIATTAYVMSNPHVIKDFGDYTRSGKFYSNTDGGIGFKLGWEKGKGSGNRGFVWVDNTGDNKGVAYVSKCDYENGSSELRLLNTSYDSSGQITNESRMGLIVTSDTAYGYAPTPDVNSNGNVIATTAWTRALIVGKADASALDALGQTVAGKQDALTFDSAPTAESVNPVTSGGVYSALGGKVNKSGDTMTGSLEIAGRNKRVSVKCDFTDSTTYMQYGTFQVNGLTGSKCWLGAGGTSERTRASFFAQCGGKSKNISIEVRPDNEWVEGITPSDPSDNSTKIPTTAWIYNNPHIVRTMGNQTIAGTKKFTGAEIQAVTGNATRVKPSTPPTDTKYFGSLSFYGSDGGETVGHIHTVRETDNSVETRIGARQTVNGIDRLATVTAHVSANGDSYALAPTPNAVCNGDEIATTQWVRKLLKSLGINN